MYHSRHCYDASQWFEKVKELDSRRIQAKVESQADWLNFKSQARMQGKPFEKGQQVLLRNDAFLLGAWPRDAAADTHKQAGRQSTALTRASSCSCHVTKRFRILVTLKQGNKSMYSNTSGYAHMGLRQD